MYSHVNSLFHAPARSNERLTKYYDTIDGRLSVNTARCVRTVPHTVI